MKFNVECILNTSGLILLLIFTVKYVHYYAKGLRFNRMLRDQSKIIARCLTSKPSIWVKNQTFIRSRGKGGVGCPDQNSIGRRSSYFVAKCISKRSRLIGVFLRLRPSYFHTKRAVTFTINSLQISLCHYFLS